MEPIEPLQQEDLSSHPLIATYPEWVHNRGHRQTKTTLSAIEAACAKQDIELLETYDRLLGAKGGAWIKYVVKAVRKKPSLGTVDSITEKQLHAYTDVRLAVNAIIYGSDNSKYSASSDRDRRAEYELFDFAISHPEQVPAVCSIMRERGFLELPSILELLENIQSSHPAIAEGAL